MPRVIVDMSHRQGAEEGGTWNPGLINQSRRYRNYTVPGELIQSGAAGEQRDADARGMASSSPGRPRAGSGFKAATI
jgi:hypothetical protein